MEDGAAVTGVILATGCLGLTSYTGSTVFDAIGSVLIGGMSDKIHIRSTTSSLCAYHPAFDNLFSFDSFFLSLRFATYLLTLLVCFRASWLICSISHWQKRGLSDRKVPFKVAELSIGHFLYTLNMAYSTCGYSTCMFVLALFRSIPVNRLQQIIEVLEGDIVVR